MTENTAPVAETIVGLLLVVILVVSWFYGEMSMSLLSIVLLTSIAIARAVLR